MNVKYPEDEDEEYMETASAWVHLNLGLLGMLEDLANARLAPNFPLFDIYWNQDPADAESTLHLVDSGSEEELDLVGDNNKGCSLYRIQNFFMNLAYRSLLYYYSKNGINFMKKEVMVHFTGKTAFESAQEFVAIEDMSYFMTEILGHDVQLYEEESINRLSSGCVVVMKHLHLSKSEYTLIPAYLPTYLIQLDLKEKDEMNSEEEENSDEEEKIITIKSKS